MISPTPPNSRRHDLDALRASAMLLGLAYHASLAFAAGFPWMVQDISQTRVLFVFQAATHGFRMPLFFLLSGFFTAMMWRKRGLKAMLHQRFRRIFLPCMLGLFTVVPATIWVSSMAGEARARRSRLEGSPAGPAAELCLAAAAADSAAVSRLLARGADPNEVHPQWNSTPLTMAALGGDTNVARQLLDRGADVNRRNGDGGTALHAAAFLGRSGMVDLLIARGADVHARNQRGDTPLQAARTDWGTTEFIAKLLGIRLDRAQVEAGRARVIQQLEDKNAPAANSTNRGGVLRLLMEIPVFLLMWFLWFLCWLVAAFAVYALIAERCGWRAPPRWLFLSPAGLLVVVPLTMIPQWFMGASNAGFGPDISMGILPVPHILFYYAIFFGFGVLYYDCADDDGLLGRRWRLTLPVGLLLVFPLALEFATGAFGFRQWLLPERLHHAVSSALQALYVWLMIFACMGLFRSLLSREYPAVRYLSDSAYWLYLAHLPLMVWMQMAIQEWRLPALLKCGLVIAAVTGFLLLIYDKAVRYTWLGTLLNGRRTRRPKPAPSVPSVDPA